MTSPLLQLALETTTRTGSIAILRDEFPIWKLGMNGPARTASAIGPAIEQAFGWCRSNNTILDFVSVADGPGSFTGLRIAVTAAKMICYAQSLPLVAVDSLAAIAASVFAIHSEVNQLAVAINAYRSQVFAGEFSRETLLAEVDSILPSWKTHPSSVDILDASQWETFCQRMAETRVLLAGDAKVPAQINIDRIDQSGCDAVGVGLIALRAAKQRQFSDPFALVPRYLRASAAEEKASKGNR